MRCPFCSVDDTRVIDSRLADDGDTVRRRRECQGCEERFTTFEHAQLRLPQVVKSDGRREPFDEVKLRGGMQRALQKRPVESSAVEAAVQRILRKVTVGGDREIDAAKIGQFVMQELHELDGVGYVRFASVYRSFEDVDAFSEAVRSLQEQPSATDRRHQLSLLEEEEPQAPTRAKKKRARKAKVSPKSSSKAKPANEKKS